MPYQFSKHYTIAEARELLPKVQGWIEELLTLRAELGKVDQLLEGRLRTGADLGGNTVNDRTRTIARFQAILGEFQTHEIQLKDLDRGLVDFPHLRAGDEVFLCWESGEDDILCRVMNSDSVESEISLLADFSARHARIR